MRPVVLLVVGARGVPLAALRASLDPWADVVLATARDALVHRPDAAAVSGADAIMAPRLAGLAEAAAPLAAARGVRGVLTVSEDAVVATALLADRLALPGIPVASLPALTDKLAQRNALRAAGVPTPAFVAVPDPRAVTAGELARLVAAVPLPAVLKPTRASGSALVHRCHSAAHLRAALDEAGALFGAAGGGTGGAVAGDSGWLLESLLVGVAPHPVAGFAPYVSVETLVAHGAPHHLAVTDRFPLAPPTLETGMMLPSCLPPDDLVAVHDAATHALTALDLRHGIAHTEVMLTAEGPRIIEVNARVGGALPYLFPLAGGPDLVAAAARLALDLPLAPPAELRGRAVFVAPQHRVGATVLGVEGIIGPDGAAAVPGVRAAIPVETGAAGPTVVGYGNSMVAAVLGTADDPADAVRLYRDVHRRIRPRYADAAVAASA